MKKLMAFLLVLLMAAALVGCGVGEAVAEKATEKAIETAGGGDVDIDGDTVTVKGEDGETLTMGGTQWPDSELIKNIPEFKKGDVSSVMDSADAVWVILESVKEEDAEEYLETIKKEYAQESFEANSEGSITYGAKNEAGVGVSLQFSDGTLTIVVSKAAE